MVKGERRTMTRERLRDVFKIIFEECKHGRKTIDELKTALYQKSIEISRESIYAYVQRMKEHVEISESAIRVKFGNVKCYSIAQNAEIDVTKIIKLRKAGKPRSRTMDDYYIKFDPPRSPLINKLFGLAA